MDGSFLSDAKVIEASRNFVCMRLATYEDAEEAKYLKQLYSGRSSRDLENTVFAMLSPDAKQRLARPGRSPSFRSPSLMATRMSEIIAQDFPRAAELRGSDATLPELKSIELALNVATCDGLPLIVTIGQDQAELRSLLKSLLPVAWNGHLAGQFVFASATSGDDFRCIPGINAKQADERAGIYVVQPDAYGLTGKLVTKEPLAAIDHKSKSRLGKLVQSYTPIAKNHRDHVRQGVMFGLKWETAVPVTDAMSLRATQRIWDKSK